MTVKTYPQKPLSDIVASPENDKVKWMYQIHKYWARKPWYVVAEYIKHFSRKGEVVLDPFCGSGVTGIEAIVQDRTAYLVDLNPIATFIAKATAMVDFNPYDLKSVFHKIAAKCQKRIQNLYQLQQKCSICNGEMETRHLLRGPKFETPIVQAYCSHCGRKENIRRELTQKELSFLADVESKPISAWYPEVPFPSNFDKDRVTYKGVKYVHQIFTPRNLRALTWIREAISEIEDEKVKTLMLVAFSNTLLHVSKLKAENVRPMAVNNYWIPDDWIEENVWYRFNQRFKVLQRAKRIALNRISKEASENLSVYTGSATKLPLQDESVDYVFTDPPYGDSIQYSELSYIWNAWLKEDFPVDQEVIINRSQNKEVTDYQQLLSQAFKEIYRVLKPGRWLTLCFHNKKFDTWKAILHATRDAGFMYKNAVPQKPMSQSFTQVWAKNSPKTDLLINLYKPSKKRKKSELKYSDTNLSLEHLIKRVQKELPEESKNELDKIYDQIIIKLIEFVFYAPQEIEADKYSIYKVEEKLKKI